MKQLKTFFLTLAVAAMALPAQAQFMPVVYDNVYGKGSQFIATCADFQTGDIVTALNDGGRIALTWMDRNGEPVFTKTFGTDDLATINGIFAVTDTKVLVVGSRSISEKDKGKKRQTGRAMIINREGGIERSLYIGEEGTVLTSGTVIHDDYLILSGTTPNSKGTMSGLICKISPKDKVLYSYMPATGETCDTFDVFGSRTEYINAGFSSANGKGSSVVKLDENGGPFYITKLPDPTFKIEKMVSTVDGDVYLVGQGDQAGGVVVKIRPEGDIVFHKQIAPASAQTKLDKLIVYPTGELLVGGNDNQNAYFCLLRSDGTELSSNLDRGVVAAIASGPSHGECIVSIYNPESRQGKVIKISKQGKRLYEKMAAANYTALRINTHGDLLMAAPQTGRVSMLSSLGELLFDRHVVENTPQKFNTVELPVSGEVIFTGENNRIAKLAHGIYVGDIIVNKPINGFTTAVFTVTLSGYAFNSEGSPLPVTVNYKTTPVTAAEKTNYEAVSGTISFVPSTDGSDRYLNKQTIEVPVTANDLLEGNRVFTLDLSDANQSYVIKKYSKATIEDQPAIVKMISTTAGVEGEKDINFTLGIFKTNGTPLFNATEADVVIDGFYGNGTADPLDYDMGRMPRLTIAPGQHKGEFNVITLEDTRYESVKDVVVNFNKVFAMSDTDVSFGGNLLSCVGQIYDQPAMVKIESLGDHTKLNNVVSGLFKVSLIRAKDGALQVNTSGADIIITPVVNSTGTAVQGTDFILSNSHDLRIWGDDKSSAVNLNGMVLFSPEKGTKTVSVSLKDVKAGENAGPISISGDNTATFSIINN